MVKVRVTVSLILSEIEIAESYRHCGLASD